MQFFKVEGYLEENFRKKYETRRDFQQEVQRKIRMSSENLKTDLDVLYTCMALVDGNKANFVFFYSGTREESVTKIANRILEFIDITLFDVVVEEITIEETVEILQDADCEGYIPSARRVMGKYNLSGTTGSKADFLMREDILKVTTREQQYKSAEKYFVGETLTQELDRIYAGSSTKKPVGNPVHYCLQIDNIAMLQHVETTLIEALYTNGRITNRRYTSVRIGPSGLNKSCLSDLYDTSKNGVVIVDMHHFRLQNSNKADRIVEGIVNFCNEINKNRNKVLTIIAFSKECNLLWKQFEEELEDLSFVWVTEQDANYSCAKKYLKALAKENSLRPDKRLYRELEEDQIYTIKELDILFKDWMEYKVKYVMYPQYKDIASCKKQAVISEEKGKAYKELMEMVGLTSAKKVIDQAIAYSKAQILFGEKGIDTEPLSRHMVFTGNPGTAKTTVARLFSKVMSDNKILSRGHLVEVGRGDLVGEYVGWTAKIVQKKFKEAEGGVLFIDEAYSLTEDHKGSYGDEAINTIVQEMENHRDDVVVIFAGYPKEMEEFLDRNPGLRSRIAFHIPFEDYTPSELVQIAELMLKRKHMRIDEKAKEVIYSIFDAACNQSDFGNGRFVRNVIEKARMAQASRLLSLGGDNVGFSDLRTIVAEDFAEIGSVKKPKESVRRIGFAG